MSSFSLTRYENNGIELIINTATGESFASVSGYARLSGKAKSTISERFGKLELEVAEIETTSGVKTVRLIPEELIVEWLPKDNPVMATQLMRIGVRVYLHKLAGFEVISTATNPQIELPKTYLEALKALVASEEQKQLLEAQNKQLEGTIKQNASLVEYAQQIQFSDDSIEFGEYARLIGTGRNRLTSKLRELGILMQKSAIPYQKYFDAGYFELSQEIVEGTNKNGEPTTRLIPFALITGKGQLWLFGKLKQSELIEKRAIAGIAQGVLNFCGY